MKLNKRSNVVARQQEKNEEKFKIEEAHLSLERERHQKLKRMDQYK